VIFRSVGYDYDCSTMGYPTPADLSRFLMFLGCFTAPTAVIAQTPSPLQEWQYSSGLILAGMFEPDLPEFRVISGVGSEVQPIYDGSRAYRVRGGPVIDVQFKDVAFISTGDGIGYNVIHKRGLQLGVSVAYDLGRKERDDYTNLTGMGDKPVSAVPKLFGAWVMSQEFPLVIRSDIRHLLRTGGGSIADLGAYFPLPGSSPQLAMFFGPSITVANRRYLQDMYGVTNQESASSGHAAYSIKQSGIESMGLGFSATWTLSRHYLVNIETAVNHLGHLAADSPLVERASGHVVALSFDYTW
jgi:outer membrane scaffolding protein for murein synthesis (MipA/OmpV family)